jgi:hypothetical protein
MTERADFEALIRNQPLHWSCVRLLDGYESTAVELDWCAWQERAMVGAASQQIVASQQGRDHHQLLPAGPSLSSRPARFARSTGR